LVLLLLSLQASRFILASTAFTPPHEIPSQGVDRSITIVFFLICLEGLCGGSAYVNTFYHVGREGEDGEEEGEAGAKRKMEKEFRIGATGASDSLGMNLFDGRIRRADMAGILFASLISMPFEIALCNAQVERGRTTCRDL
jgi:battenin